MSGATRTWHVVSFALLLAIASSAASLCAADALNQKVLASSSTPVPAPRQQYIVYLATAPPVLAYRGGIPGLAATAPEDDLDDDGDAAAGNANGAVSGTAGGSGAANGTAGIASVRVASTAAGGGTTQRPLGQFSDVVKRLGDRMKQRADVRAAKVKEFARFLRRGQALLLKSLNISVNSMFNSYTYTANGFAASLTAAEAQRLESHPHVAMVEPDAVVTALTVDSPTFLKLPQSLWALNGGQASAGEGVIVGVIDSGIWPEHPSFANDPSAPYGPAPVRWRGSCQATADFPADRCNGKLIGARYFNKGFLAGNQLDQTKDFYSARDGNGHGTWCASAAAGNAGIPVVAGARNFGTASGVAPRARVAAYKALWSVPGGEASGSNSDIRAALEAAVEDGVDVLSLSLGGAVARYFSDVPYMNAAKAGVFISFAAGNSGPPSPLRMLGTVSNAAPWYLTVGASTIGRNYRAVLTLGDGTELSGDSYGGTAATVGVQMLDASKAVKAGGDAAAASRCDASNIDSSKTVGRIIVCTYLPSAAATSSHKDVLADAASLQPAALVLVSGSSDTDAISMLPYTDMPLVYLANAKGAVVKAYLQRASSPTATLGAYTASMDSPAPAMAFFSSTGPTINPRFFPTPAFLPTNDILKPDIIGPGFQLWAAFRGSSAATAASDPATFNLLSGTSMATPHLAGIGALILQKNPSWTPAQVMSAIMSTAYTVNNKGQPIKKADGKVATPWDYGSGHVDATRVLDPGLTFNTGFTDYVNFLAGRDLRRTKKFFPGIKNFQKIKPFNLNRPTVAVARLPRQGIQIVRRVTNVYSSASTYSVKVQAPPNVNIKVTPTQMTLTPGQTQRIIVQIKATRGTRAFGYGSLKLSDQHGHVVRIPLVVRPVSL
eukprot:TRINITY_DN4267_c0_g2_i1.p1 TRINITY_DN4267_c0_g2~~TRINITY_DN4267_c0_g2_i1.p1  ORF type:complete len:892 (-),score=1.72 TRINITY_DN4267_c0_g2_i1:264-2939(-)